MIDKRTKITYKGTSLKIIENLHTKISSISKIAAEKIIFTP